jgi:hypothetical protein
MLPLIVGEGNSMASGIHINPAHKGRFHRDVGKSPGEKITSSDIEKGKHSDNPAERKRATFAANARKWHHGKSHRDKDVHRAKHLYGKKEA